MTRLSHRVAGGSDQVTSRGDGVAESLAESLRDEHPEVRKRLGSFEKWPGATWEWREFPQLTTQIEYSKYLD